MGCCQSSRSKQFARKSSIGPSFEYLHHQMSPMKLAKLRSSLDQAIVPQMDKIMRAHSKKRIEPLPSTYAYGSAYLTQTAIGARIIE